MEDTEKRSRKIVRRQSELDVSTLFLPSEDVRERIRRPYQDEAVAVMNKALKRPSFSILALPPGSGKTFVANEIVHDVVVSGGTVLWLALNWELLVQAASAYARRFDGVAGLARLGGEESPLFKVLPEKPGSPVNYTTLHRWYCRRSHEQLSSNRLALLVIDDCHCGMNATIGRALLTSYYGKVPILGLSATPRHLENPSGSAPARIDYVKTFAELQGSYLAEPRLETVLTNTNWRPFLMTTGDFSPASLRELAADEARNELICRTLQEGIRARKYSRIMVFACDIEHADSLANLFSNHGIDARALHCEVSTEARKSELKAEFKTGRFNVLINLAMLTHGIDVPEVDAVFLTRPTASEILCSQMVGRGARLIDGKKREFWIVEFTDNLERHSDEVFHVRNLLPAAKTGCSNRKERGPAKTHVSPPRDARVVPLIEPPEVAGLTYVEDQTFGVEIEFTSPLGSPDSTGIVYRNWKWQLVGLSILQVIESVANYPVDAQLRNYHEVDDTERWRVEFDRSAGWEVVSPILSNQEGFSELVNVLSALNVLLFRSDHLHINHRTGLHVTLGSGFTQDAQVQGLVRLIQILEPGLFTLVCPSRFYEVRDDRYCLRRNNKYCLPLRNLDVDVAGLKLDSLGKKKSSIRYRTVNLSRVGREDPQIEIRLHDGTTEYPVVVAWISLWMTLFNRARFHWPDAEVEESVFPGGNVAIDIDQARKEDLFALLESLDVHLDPSLRAALARRRFALLHRWTQAIPKRVESWRRYWRL
jgi:superfamily II DNA or RNA helicase